MPIQTRPLTGKPSWPITLLTGPEKVGKTWDAAVASSSKHINRTFWVAAGEDVPDELGTLPGVRAEVVPHNGTYKGILKALTDAAAAAPGKDGKPNLIVLDSATKLWNLLSNIAQAEANKRKKADPLDEAQITMDLWNLATQRWNHCIDVLRNHQGPSIVTSRLDIVTLLDDDGRPSKDRRGRVITVEKIQAQKNLAYDVGVVVKKPELGTSVLTAARSVKLAGKLPVTYEDGKFSVDQLWVDLGVTAKGATSNRDHMPADEDVVADRRRPLLEDIKKEAERLERDLGEIAQTWFDVHRTQINQTADLDALTAFRDGLMAEEKVGVKS